MIYQNILKLCKERGISIRQLEEESGVGIGAVHHWRKRSVPRVDNLKQVADYLGVTLDDLVSDEAQISKIHGSVTVKDGENYDYLHFFGGSQLVRFLSELTDDKQNLEVRVECVRKRDSTDS